MNIKPSGDLDTLIREGLDRDLQGVGEIEADELARRLSTPERHPAHRRPWLVAAAAVLIAALVGAGLVVRNIATAGRDDVQVVADEPKPQDVSPLAGYGPGWHLIDTTGLPASEFATMALVGSELVVAFKTPPDPGTPTYIRAYDLLTKRWRDLPEAPLYEPQIVGAGDRVIAVSDVALAPMVDGETPVPRWAVLEGLDGPEPRWSDPQEVPTAPELADIRELSRMSTGLLNLLWTGDRVLDMTHGAVLDPVALTADPLELPQDPRLGSIGASNAVWAGDEAVLAAISEREGLTWNSRGELSGTVPAPMAPSPGVDFSSWETSVVGGAGQVVLFDRTGSGQSVELDVTSGTWTRLPEPGRGTIGDYCPAFAAWVTMPVVESCGSEGTDSASRILALADQQWLGLPPGPLTASCGWLGTSEALFVIGDPPADSGAAVGAALWVPDAELFPAHSPTPEPSTGDDDSVFDVCTVDSLPHLGPYLPDAIAQGPTFGMGGGGGPSASEGPCSRYWSAGEESGRYITQSPGSSPWTIANPSTSGEYRWGEIHEGFSVEFTGEPEWSAQGYGIGREDFEAMVQKLIAAE